PTLPSLPYSFYLYTSDFLHDCSSYLLYYFLTIHPPPLSPLFPYTTLFRSPGPRDRKLPRRFVDCPLVPARACHRHSRWYLTRRQDRKSTRLNSSHVSISYAVFCLKKKNDDSYYIVIICLIIVVLYCSTVDN